MSKNTSGRRKIVKPYYKYKQESFANLVKAVEGVVSRGWGTNKPLNFLPKDFVFEITYTLDSFKKISIYHDGGFLGEITYENGGAFYNYYKWEESSAKVEKKKVHLTSQEFKSLRKVTLNLGKLAEDEPSDVLFHYVVKASEYEISRYNPFPGGGVEMTLYLGLEDRQWGIQ
jgi:hypothetical protein